ncbi:MAG TPA: rubredoxin [Candidatus Pelethosoma merdigallinarum]|nr:rubredoxin [Candidatus Pelethosoma merdigallinarum]
MKRYRCKICGHVYDEAKEQVKFEDLPDDWKCPLCGAPKNLFEEIKEEKSTNVTQMMEEEMNPTSFDEDLRNLSSLELSLICSNLARGCEKQYLEKERQLFQELATYYEEKDSSKEGTLNDVKQIVGQDLKQQEQAMNVADHHQDRGAKRVLTWAGKSTNIMNMILDNYEKKGIDYLKNTKIWVCDICGFVYIGDVPPTVCPICKVPNFKILEVK